jgi:hypothetical protein
VSRQTEKGTLPDVNFSVEQGAIEAGLSRSGSIHDRIVVIPSCETCQLPVMDQHPLPDLLKRQFPV